MAGKFRKFARTSGAGCLWVAVVLAGFVEPQPLAAQEDAYHAQYGLLAQHNIFKKDRLQHQTAPDRPAAAPPSLEQQLVVTGIVCKDNERYAILENTANGTSRRVHDGDRVAHGMIAGIEIGQLWYIPDGQNAAAVAVLPGENLAGLLAKAASFR